MKLRADTLLFLGWFGPRGIASVLYVLLVLDRHAIGGRQEIFAIVVATVLISVFAHGLTAFPGANWYAARVEETKKKPGATEHVPVEEMPVRVPYSFRNSQPKEVRSSTVLTQFHLKGYFSIAFT